MQNGECRMMNSKGERVPGRTARTPRLNSAFCILHFAFVSLLAPALVGQTASPFVPASYWGSPYIEHFIASGRMVDPTPLTRPLRADQVVRALEAMDTTRLWRGELRVVRTLLADLRRTEEGPYGRIDADVGVAAATYDETDPLELR